MNKTVLFCLAKILAVSILILASVHTCSAHTLFIQSSRYQVQEGKSTPLFFCYGHHIPVDDGVRSKKLKSITIVSPKGETMAIAIRKETGLHSYMVSYDTPGTWILSAVTNPGFYTVYTDKKGRERHAIKPMSKVRDKAVEIHTSLYSKQYAKTYVVCDNASPGRAEPAGLDLELIPAKDFFSLNPGQALTLEIFYKGEPFQGEGTWDATYNGFSTQSEDMFHPQTKVEGSSFSVPIPNPGRWFIRYFVKMDAPESEKGNYRQLKLTATLTFQIDNPPKNPKQTNG